MSKSQQCNNDFSSIEFDKQWRNMDDFKNYKNKMKNENIHEEYYEEQGSSDCDVDIAYIDKATLSKLIRAYKKNSRDLRYT